jgi:hypothetical protein
MALGRPWRILCPDFPATALANAMRWRAIGPFRGGRTKAITGVAGSTTARRATGRDSDCSICTTAYAMKALNLALAELMKGRPGR